jgi:hypothetical protein
MGNHLNEALKHFEAAEANLAKLRRLWDGIEEMLPSLHGIVIAGVGDEALYREKQRAFEHIAAALPAIDGFRLECCIVDCEGIQATNLDLHELDEPAATMAYEAELRRQGVLLSEYAFRLGVKRRALARQHVITYLANFEARLEGLRPVAAGLESASAMPADLWEPLKHDIEAINTLLGSSFQRPKRWTDLSRHLAFGLAQDFFDLVNRDWPAVKPELERALYTDDDPIPSAVADLGELVSANPTGDVVTELKWQRLTPQDFERLLYNLITGTPGYENPEWLTHTNAPDDGRDLSVYRVHMDKLAGTTRRRVVIGCKHWTSRKVDLGEIMLLKEQMCLWEPPRVDCLVVATSGRFTTQAVHGIEKHNQSNSALKIEPWAGSHFEWLLAQRPALIAEFRLR